MVRCSTTALMMLLVVLACITFDSTPVHGNSIRDVEMDAVDSISHQQRRLLQSIDPALFFNQTNTLCNLIGKGYGLPPAIESLHCLEGYSCQMPLTRDIWNEKDSPYPAIVSLNQTGYIPPFNDSASSPDNGNLTMLYEAVELCRWCLQTGLPQSQQYGPCYVLNSTNACPGYLNISVVAIGLCLPCRGGQYCAGGNATAPIGETFDNMCLEGKYCPDFGTQLDCPPGNFCPRGTRHPINCSMPGSYCPVGSKDPLTECSAGFYCPSSAVMVQCPKRHYCRSSSVAPKPCAFFSWCPPGTSVPIQLWVGIFLATCLLTLLAVVRKARAHIRRFLKAILRFLCPCSRGDYSTSNGNGKHAGTIVPPVKPAIPSCHFSITIRSLRLQKGQNKILDGIDLKLKSGLVMIQGTSGCGKSTLIKCLSGKTQNELSDVTGVITFADDQTGESTSIHAFPQSPLNTPKQIATWESFQSHVGYVPQDDVVHEDLTVRDNIAFASALRRPGLNRVQQEALLQDMLSELQLTKQSRNLITNISGGQRKRVNIAWDRCSDPQFLILDEPTSGLDATTSLTLTEQLLKFCYPDCVDTSSLGELSKVRGTSHKLVLMVIHQPRVEIFHAADQVIFLDRGHVVYSGSPLLVAAYFRSDPWLTEVAAQFPVLKSANAAEADFCMDYVNSFNVYEKPGEPAAGSKHMAQRWLEECTTNANFAAYAVSTKDFPREFSQWPDTLRIDPTPRPSPLVQFRFLLLRHVKKFSHAFDSMCFDLALIIFAAFASGMINGSDWKPMDYPGIALMSVVGMGALASVVNVRLYGNDRLQTRRELQSGMHALGYWFSIFLMDLGRLATYPFVYFVIFYNFIVPSSPSIPMYAVYWSVYWCCGGFGQFMSLLLSLQTAYLGAALLPLIIGGFLNGVSPTLKSLKETPLLYITGSASYARWACERLCSLEFNQLPDYQESLRVELFQQWGFNPHDGLQCILFLLAMGVIMRLASILVLVASTGHFRMKTRAMFIRLTTAWCGPPFPTAMSSSEDQDENEVLQRNIPRSSTISTKVASSKHYNSTVEAAEINGNGESKMDDSYQSADTSIQLDSLSDMRHGLLGNNTNNNNGASARTPQSSRVNPFTVFLVLLSLAFITIFAYLLTY